MNDKAVVWHNTADVLPDDDEDYLVFYLGRVYVGCFYPEDDSGDCWWVLDGVPRVVPLLDVSHWAVLPDPPEDV